RHAHIPVSPGSHEYSRSGNGLDQCYSNKGDLSVFGSLTSEWYDLAGSRCVARQARSFPCVHRWSGPPGIAVHFGALWHQLFLLSRNEWSSPYPALSPSEKRAP